MEHWTGWNLRKLDLLVVHLKSGPCWLTDIGGGGVIIDLDNGLLPVQHQALSKPIMTSHQLHPKEQTSIKNIIVN